MYSALFILRRGFYYKSYILHQNRVLIGEEEKLKLLRSLIQLYKHWKVLKFFVEELFNQH